MGKESLPEEVAAIKSSANIPVQMINNARPNNNNSSMQKQYEATYYVVKSKEQEINNKKKKTIWIDLGNPSSLESNDSGIAGIAEGTSSIINLFINGRIETKEISEILKTHTIIAFDTRGSGRQSSLINCSPKEEINKIYKKNDPITV